MYIYIYIPASSKGFCFDPRDGVWSPFIIHSGHFGRSRYISYIYIYIYVCVCVSVFLFGAIYIFASYLWISLIYGNFYLNMLIERWIFMVHVG